MPTTTLRQLLERNSRHIYSLSDGHFDAVEDSQSPAAVSICCADSRVSQEGMWDVTEPGWLFTPSTIGNQVWDCHDGDRVVDGNVLYPVAYTETETITIVGHTGCGAVTAALDTVKNGTDETTPPGVTKWIELLIPVIEEGLADDRTDPARDARLVDQLVEYNVDRQIEFLRESDEIPDETSIFGFVYDFQGIYGDCRGRAYLVNVDGETDRETIREMVPAEFNSHINRLL